MSSPKRSILPDLHDAEYDEEEYRREHFDIFQHWPVGRPCEHPLHGQIKQVINGADIEIPFDASMIVSEDSVLERERQDRYDAVFQDTRQFQRAYEERKARERLERLGLTVPGKVY